MQREIEPSTPAKSMSSPAAFADGEAVEHAGVVYFSSPTGVEPAVGNSQAVRLRRLPHDEHGQADANGVLRELHGRGMCTQNAPVVGNGPVLVDRCGSELPSSLVFPEERLCDSLDLPTSNERALNGSETQLPVAHAKGPPLLPFEHGGTPHHATLSDALAATAASPTLGARGIVYDSSSGERFQSYKQLFAAAWQMLGALQVQGIVQGDCAIFQCTHADRLLHVEAIWGCILGGFTFVNLTPP